MISRRENLLRVFRHEMPEWIPVTGHCDPYNQPHRAGMDPDLAKKLENVHWSDESTVQLSRYMGLDIADWYSPPVTIKSGPKVREEIKTEGEDTITLWHTPAGTLRQIVRQPVGGVEYTVEHFIKSADDLAPMAAYYENLIIEPDQSRLPELERRRALIGDDGIIMASMAGTPLSELIRKHAGVETTTYLTVDVPDMMKTLFAVMTRRQIESHSLAASLAGVDAIVGVDDTSTTTQSPAMFEEYCVDYTNRMADAVHAQGKLYIHHSCGLIKDLVGLYRQTRMDAVHALQIPPLGNITIREAKQALGDRIVIYATLNQMFGSLENWPAVCQSIREMFEGAAPGNNFLLVIGADPNVNMTTTMRFWNEVQKYQRMYSPNR